MSKISSGTGLVLAIGTLSLIKVAVDSKVVARDVEKTALSICNAVGRQCADPDAYLTEDAAYADFIKAMSATLIELGKLSDFAAEDIAKMWEIELKEANGLS